MNSNYPFLQEMLQRYHHSDITQRFLVGIVGPPASGKSYLAALLPEKVNKQLGEEVATHFAMDAYHYFNKELYRKGIYPHKGAHFTFDVQKFTEKLLEIKESPDDISCPIYDRTIENPTPDGHVIEANHRIVFVEGNYLLSRVFPWGSIRYILDASIFLEVDEKIQWDRLLERHLKIGRSRAEAEAKIRRTDLPNTKFILDDMDRADWIFRPEPNFSSGDR